MKQTFFAILIFFLSLAVFCPQSVAGGVDNLQNFSARYLATGSRNAATDGVDIAAYNPAGIMRQQDGFAIGGDVQYIAKTYEQTYTTALTSQKETNDQDEPSIIPALFATYKKDNFGVFGSVTINGGGGAVNYENGNVATNLIEGMLANDYNYGANALLSNEWIEAESYYVAYTLGGSYAVNDLFSVAAGIRFLDATTELEAYADTAGLGDLTGAYEGTGNGWGFVASMNYAPTDDLLLTARYESKIKLKFETDIDESKTNTLGTSVLSGLGKTEGSKSNRDLPAVLGLGMGWDVTDKLNLNTSFNYYFEDDADWEGLEADTTGSWDLGVSGTYRIQNNVRVSLGYVYTDIGYDPDDYYDATGGANDLTSMLSPSLDAHTLLGGVSYDLYDQFTVNLGLSATFYEKDGTIGSTTAEYDKEATALALGVEHRF